MKALRGLARRALRSYPRDFRRQFADEILCDVEAEPERFAINLFEIVQGGIAMHIEDFGRDLAYAFARLRRAPLFVAIVTVTFALGIGVNVAVFSAINAVILRPLPFTDPGRLVSIVTHKPLSLLATGPLSAADVADLRSQLHSVSSISAIGANNSTMLVAGKSKTLRGATVSSTFFETLGAAPEIGRLLGPSDSLPGQDNVVISDRLWRTTFNGDPGILGRRIPIGPTLYAVVGVTRPDAQTPNPHPLVAQLVQPDYFTALPNASTERSARTLGVVASLAPGSTVEQLNAELNVVSNRLQLQYPADDAKTVFVAQPLKDQLVGPFSLGLWMVFLAAFGILLIACANIANLIAARWSAREHEVAVRRALGASVQRIAVQLFIETGVLAVCGGVAGVLLAFVCLRVVPLTALDAIPRAQTIGIDGATLAFAVLIVGVTTIVAGVVPVLSLGRAEVQLMSGARPGGNSSRRNGLRSALVVAEVAIALALVIASGLVVRSYVALLNTPLGINTDGVYVSTTHVLRAKSLFSSVNAPTATTAKRVDALRAARPARIESERQLLSRVKALPGIDAASIVLTYPLGGIPIFIGPQVLGNGDSGQNDLSAQNVVSADYFRALGMPLLRGRAFTDGDSTSAPSVAIVNQAFVDKFMHGRDALGARIKVGAPSDAEDPWITVVGVVPNERDQLRAAPSPTLYVPFAQADLVGFSVVVRAERLRPEIVRNELQSAFLATFPGADPPGVLTIAELLANETKTERSAAALLAALAVIPLLLALSGIFGVVSFSVVQRSREFGIRMALGASARHVFADVLRRALLVTALGVVIGTVLAAVGARAVARYITISPLDPTTFGIVIGLVFVFAAVAALLPALRATRVDPVIVLRYE